MSTFNSIRPKQIEGFKCYLVSGFNNKAMDISKNISKLEIFESIHQAFLTAELTVMDDSNILSEFPIIGQEVVEIQVIFKDKEIVKDFHVSEVVEVTTINENAGAYKLKLISSKQFRNSTQTFSRAYSGRNTDIIANIHEDFFEERPEVMSEGSTSHNIVFPYMKPLQAIDMMIRNTSGSDGSPLFLFDSLHGENTVLASLNDLLFEDALVIKNINTVNSDPNGQGLRALPAVGTSVDVQAFKRGFPTYRNINEGYFAANLTTINVPNKTYSEETYDYKSNTEQGDIFCIDYTSPDFKYQGQTLDQINSAAHLFYQRNTSAFSSPTVGLINNQDSVAIATRRAYRNLMTNNTVVISMDNSSQLTVGMLVDLHFKRFKPNLDQGNDYDPLNSGQYLCSAIKHTFKGEQYSMTIEAIRSGINYEVEI